MFELAIVIFVIVLAALMCTVPLFGLMWMFYDMFKNKKS